MVWGWAFQTPCAHQSQDGRNKGCKREDKDDRAGRLHYRTSGRHKQDAPYPPHEHESGSSVRSPTKIPPANGR